MWSGPGPDPGGPSGGPPTSQELYDLKDQFEQQQLLIAQLKEMLRKSEQTTVTQEKVEEYANTLTKMKARAKRAKKDGNRESTTKRLETPASEKINLLRQQLEENRAKLAERGKNQKGIEDMVTQLKAQLDDSQILMNQTPLNLSLTEIKQESYSINSSSQELYNILINKEKRISEMTLRIQKLEANVLDLQENVKEKDSVIDARTKAITLMSENLSKKGKSTLEALDDTKLQMRKMQENFIELETDMKEEKLRLTTQVHQQESEIVGLKQRNTYLEEVQHDLNAKIIELQNKVDNPEEVDDIHEKLQHRIKELEEAVKSKESSSNVDIEQALNDSNKKCEELKLKLEESEKKLEEKELAITEYVTTINKLESTVQELEIKTSATPNVKTVNLDIKLENKEITKLKKQLDESNKNMIKVKAQHKSKIKELNKKVDSFRKMSDANAEVVKLHDEIGKLNQKVAELEEEKGALQLKIMETDSAKESTNVESVNELEKKLSEQSLLLTEKDANIDTLTKRVEDLSGEVKDLDEKLSKLTHLQNVQVKSEITSIQLEEQMDQLMMERQVLIKEKEAVLEENATLTEKLENLQKEKQEILIKLESYMQENIDLVDKLEKLSAEKVSSAESIEIVEGLTQQEKLELAAYQTNSNIPSDIKTSHEHLEESPELNESVTQLTEETSELLQKIELFTLERREVMEKMEQLTHENNQLNLKIKEIENNREVLAETYEQLQNEKESLDSNLEYLKNENATLQDKIKELESEQEEVKKLYEKDRNEDNMLKEIEEYKSLIEIQRQEIKELRVQVMGQDFIKTDKLELEAKINSLQLQYDNIVLENDTLMNKLKEQSEHVCQRKDLEEELLTARKRIEDFEKKISDNLEEIENYKSILDENKNELISSANTITELQSNVTALKNEVGHYNDEVMHLNSVITDLNAAIAHLEKENEENSGNAVNMSAMTIQLEELKQALTENIEQINVYQQELQNNSVTIIQLQNEIKDLNIKMLETEHLLESKNDELRTVQKEKEEKDNIIQQLQQDLKSKDENFHQIVNDLKQKYVNLQAQLETNTGSIDNIRQPLENKIQELEQKNKEQLEKMKIIAANLKKKTQALQNLEQKYTEVNEKWETEQKEKETLKEIAAKNATLENELQLLLEKYNSSQNDVANQSTECQKLKEELCEYKHKFNCLENMNTKLSEEISNYIAQYEDSQNTIREYEHRISELSKRPDDHNSEINKKNSIIEDLTDQLNVLRESSKTNSDALQMKIQEMEMFTETQDAELAKYKERVSKLEEGLSFMEERRMSLERTAQRLGAQLEEKTNECEEVSHTEDMLERRLTALISHDQIIEKKLEEVTLENEELNNQLKNIIAENGELKEKVREMKDLLNKSHDEAEMLNTIENEVLGLRKEISALENDKKNIKNEYEEKLRALKVDNEKMETELQTQLDSFDTDRKTLAEKIEHMTDHLKEYVEQQDVLTSEITEYKEKLNEQNNLIVNTNQAYNKLQEEFQSSVLASDQLKELIKNQEDTISQLNEQIVIYKDAETKRNEQKQHSIESEISQKSIQNLFNEPSQLDLASSFFVDQDTQHLRQTNENLIVQVNTLHKEKENIERILAETQHQLEETLQIATNKEEPLKSEELKSLKAQYNTLEMNYGKLSEENISLQNNIARLNEQLQSSNQLESQIENKSQEIRTFTWPGEEIIEVNISASSTDAPKIDNTKEELLNKIRSLEFMLHDTEQQKENAMIQCNALSEELTKLVYLQEQQKQLQQTANVDVESLIIPPEKTEMTSADLSQLHEYEFSPSKDIVDHQETIPVVEEVIEPKTSYLCYDPEEAKNKHVTDTFGENDDGWGWSSEEANLEQEYYEQASATPQSTQFKNQINVLEEKIKVLEQARERHLDEIQQSQLKSSKLIKKLKEFKAKNEELASQLNKKSDTFDDLNDAIQEELKTQIKNLEKKIKEISADLEKEKLEKESLLKRVDTLTATHERMVENKEKQDIEIMSWQRRCRELNEKLEQFEWGDDESPKHVKRSDQTPSETQIPDAAKCIQELNNTIKDLTLDNEELQALLEEQRNLRIAAEKSKTFEPVAENVRSESEYLVVVNERNSLQKDIDLAKENMIKLTEDYSNLLMVNEAIEEKCRLLTSENQQLREVSKSELDELARQIDKINVEKQNLIEEKDRNVCVIEELHQKLNNLQNNVEINANNERKQYEERISELNSALTSLNAQLYSLSTENNALQIKITDLERYKENFAIEINQKDVLISELNLKISNLEEQLLNMQNVNSEIIQIKESLTRKEEELANFSAKLLEKEQENEFKLSHTVQQLATEWAQKVDQRGYDVAESWKLHLEARENEFLEVESQLKKEIADFEEKYTTLVNENNELRKNVDAEIRNEVDRIAALQQQINERQHYINDLSKTLQDQQNEIEKQKIEISNLSASVVELKEQIDSKNKEINSIEETLKKKNDLLKSYEENDLLFKTEKETEIKSLKEALNLKDIEIHNIDNRFVQSLQQVEELSQINKNLVVDLEERIKLVNDLSKRLEDVENNKQVNSEQVSLLNQQIAEYQAQCSHYNHELQQRDMEIDALKQSMLMYHNMEEALSHKDIEIKQLKDLIEEKEREHSIVLDSSAQEKSNAIKEYMVEIENLKRKLLDSENQYEEILVTKDVDMQNLRAQLEEQIKRNESYQKEKEDLLHVQTELGIKTAECNEMSAKLQEQNLLISEEAKQLDDLREIIQDQVLKIEALQKELYDKSTMYDASIAEIDLTHKSETTRKSDKHVKFSDEIDVKNTSASSNEDDLSEPVSRAELDLALYMLHQRDVRCEELTVELMQLLEERDTLQLKLSNALREKEILMSKYEISPNLNESHSIIEQATEVSPVDVSASGSQELKPSASDPLISKISELKTLSYRKDKTIVDEQELRRLQQLSIMQQHRDEASKLPAEAAARLVDANYTLSRDVQSPSKVLLNWLWGRSTPKVNNV